MDIGRAFTYLTEDQEWWKKILILGLISLIPVAGQLYVLGYVLTVLKNVIQGQEVPLPPAVDDFGGRIVKGLMIGIIIFIYVLPVGVLVVCSSLVPQIFLTVIDNESLATTLMTVWMGCFGCITLIVGVLSSLLVPFLWGVYADTENFGAAFQLGKIFGMLKSTIGPALIVIVVLNLFGLVAALVGMLICGVGEILTFVYTQLVAAFLYGSLYKQARGAVL